MKKLALTNRTMSSCLLVLTVSLIFPGAVFAQEVTQEEQGVSKEETEKYNEVKKAARKEKVAVAAEADKTGNDPRVFVNKWTPYYRSTELENGLTQQDMTAFGTFALSPVLGVFYEVPLAQYRDFSDMDGVPEGTDSIGMGDIDLKFLYRPKGLDFHYGKDGKKSGSWLFGTDFVLPTGTSNDGVTGNAFLFSPIVGVVVDMPAHGFFAMLNLYYFDVYKEDSAPETSRYVGRWFYMQPLTPPGKWWGALYLMPEFQPVYDFEAEDFSLWVGVEFGKGIAPGRIAYIKPGWGSDNTEATDRSFTFEAGFRWMF